MEWIDLMNTGLKNKQIRELMLKHNNIYDVLFDYKIDYSIRSKLKDIKKYKIDDKDTRIICYHDEEYPDFLRQINDFPPFLFLQGKKLDIKNSVSIVGTRNCTKLGENSCIKIVSGLKEYEDISIISGMAKGIDSIAHIEALKNNIYTVAVLPTNIYDCYPLENKKLKQKIIENGTILTEIRPFQRLKKTNFAIRNRIVAALSRAVCIIEAPKSSGALITAKFAIYYDREVYATPSNIFDKNFEGSNDLIKKNVAKLIQSADDIAYEYGWRKNEKVFSNS